MYQLVPVLKGLLNFYRRGSRHGGGDINAEKLRVERLKGDILEIERDKKRGKLADTKQVEVIWEGLAMSMRGKLLSLPAKLSPLVLQCKTVEECRRQLETEINDVLAELSKPHDYATDAQQTAAEVIALTDEPDYDEAEAEADATPTAGE